MTFQWKRWEQMIHCGDGSNWKKKKKKKEKISYLSTLTVAYLVMSI